MNARNSPERVVSGNVLAAMEETTTPIAQSAAHEAAYRALLSGHTLADGCASELATLGAAASVAVPATANLKDPNPLLPGLAAAVPDAVVNARDTGKAFVEASRT